MISLLVHHAVLSPFGGVSVPPDFVRQMKDMSRMGLTEWPRRASEEVRERERERKSEVMVRPSVVVDDEPDAETGTGLEATRVMLGGRRLVIDGGRMVETEPPRERPDWADCEAGSAMGTERAEGVGGSEACIGGVFG